MKQIRTSIEKEIEQKLNDGQKIFRASTVRKLYFITDNLGKCLNALGNGTGRKLEAEYKAYLGKTWAAGMVAMNYVDWLEETHCAEVK